MNFATRILLVFALLIPTVAYADIDVSLEGVTLGEPEGGFRQGFVNLGASMDGLESDATFSLVIQRMNNGHVVDNVLDVLVTLGPVTPCEDCNGTCGGVCQVSMSTQYFPYFEVTGICTEKPNMNFMCPVGQRRCTCKWVGTIPVQFPIPNFGDIFIANIIPYFPGDDTTNNSWLVTP